MFTEKCSHLVVRWRCSPCPWKGVVHCCHLPPVPPPISLTIRTGLICPAVMPTQSCSCGSANLNVSCLVLVYYQRGIHHHSCQVSSRSFLRQTPVSPQLSGLLLYCDFLFTQHMLPNSFKRQLSFMKVFFFFFFFLTFTNYKHTFIVFKGKNLSLSCTLQRCTNHPKTEPASPGYNCCSTRAKERHQQPRTHWWLRCPPQGLAGSLVAGAARGGDGPLGSVSAKVKAAKEQRGR